MWPSTVALVFGVVGMLGVYLLSYIAVIIGGISAYNHHKIKVKGAWVAWVGLILGVLGVLANVGQHL